MAGPWEEFQRAPPSGPWDEFRQVAPTPRKRTAAEERRAPDSEVTSPRERTRRRLMGPAAGVTNILGQGFGFGLGDEVAGAAGAISNAIVGSGGSFVDRLVSGYNRGRDEFNADIERAERETPAGATMANVLGLAGNIAIPTRAFAGTPTLARATRMAATQGAVGGAIAGAGNADGGIGNRAAAAGIGAATGAAVGAALPVSINAVGAAIRGGARMAGRGPSVSPQVVGRALQADGGIRRAANMVDEAQARGVPLALGDTGDNARATLASVGRQPGEARTIVRDVAIARQEGQGERIAGAITRDLGPVANVRATSEALAAQAKQQAAPLYEAAYAAPIAISDDLQSIINRLPPQAVANARELARLEGRNPNTLGVDLNDLGEIVLTERPTMQTLDFIKRGLDDVVETFRDGTSGRLNLDTRGRAVNGLLRDFVSELDRINPAYAAARAAYAGPTRLAAALQKGQSAVNATADDLLVMTRDLTPAEAEQFRLGLRSGLVGKLEGAGDYANRVRQLVGTPRKRAALAQVFGGEAEFDRFLATLADEARVAQTYQSVAGNSLTAERQAFDDATGDAGLLGTATGAALDTARGNVGNAVTRIVADLRNYGAGEAGKRVRAEVAAALAETDPAVLRQALRDASRAQAGERVRLRNAGRGAIRQGQAAGNIGGGYVGRLLAGDRGPGDE